MSLPLIIRPEAEQDIADARDFYDSQPSVRDLATEFIDDLHVFLARIQRNPEMYAVVERGARLGSLDRFPYVVCYRVGKAQIDVLAVYHGKRHPRLWKGRL
jgi:toxin ParE1/3/4